ncbi:hypothetical protein EYF80_030872 [Liparis tanakae]|uniref:Uncharacterized protein n=1 Tax=Liparis tanakae TaxID=230148 RepID=A0A4Z2GZP1_9TELE|nr:hypothetical protein EYF80_030872 [Liparis tanakae]
MEVGHQLRATKTLIDSEQLGHLVELQHQDQAGPAGVIEGQQEDNEQPGGAADQGGDHAPHALLLVMQRAMLFFAERISGRNQRNQVTSIQNTEAMRVDAGRRVWKDGLGKFLWRCKHSSSDDQQQSAGTLYRLKSRRQRELERILSCLTWSSMWTSSGLCTWWARSMAV